MATSEKSRGLRRLLLEDAAANFTCVSTGKITVVTNLFGYSYGALSRPLGTLGALGALGGYGLVGLGLIAAAARRR